MSTRNQAVARRQKRTLVSMIESLESRQLLSGVALINTPITGAYTPGQIRNAYGVSALGVANEGQGVTIGIVDEFDDANITADTNAFSAYYGLPVFNTAGNPMFSVVKDTALGTVATAAGTGVGGETSLDVEWAHAMAPMANIILVEVPGSGSTYTALFNQLLHGVQYAAQLGADSISLSYGATEASIGASNVSSLATTYLSTGAAANVSVSVSTGDGSTPLFPATSPYVTAVGGTSLYLNSVKGSYGFETAWGGLANAGAGGGGLSTNFATPSFQSNNGVNLGKRAIPDVSLDADPVTAVSIYDSLDSSTAPWTSTGGTSVASPLFAGVVALVQQNRLAANLAPLTSVQLDTKLYSLYNSSSYSTDFHDVTEGSNKNQSSSKTVTAGFTATTGYDEATGIGSPIASAMVPTLSVFTPSAVLTVFTSPVLGSAIGFQQTTIVGSEASTIDDVLTGKRIEIAQPVTTPAQSDALTGAVSLNGVYMENIDPDADQSAGIDSQINVSDTAIAAELV